MKRKGIQRVASPRAPSKKEQKMLGKLVGVGRWGCRNGISFKIKVAEIYTGRAAL